MPTRDDWNELVNPDNCSWVWKVKGGAYGYKVTSKITGNSIFLHAAGYRIGTSYEGSGTNCLYWSSSLADDCPTDAWRRSFSSGNMNESINSRYTGLSVRPVYGDVHVSEMLLSDKQISIIVHDIVNLSVKIVPANATNYEILWSSNDTNVVTVDNTGKILANNAGTAVITVATTDGRFKDSCIVTVVDYSIPVDLGLSVKWASCNLGANAPEEYGDYYTWGDIETYYEDRCAQENPQKHWKSGKSEGYTKENYKFFKTEWREIGGVRYGYTKYAPKFNGWGFGEFYDNKTALDLEDDVAQIKLGGKWRMPTNAEFEELLDNCTSEWMTLNGVIGRKFISKKNGNSIFLPAAGFRYEVIFYVAQPLGRYWSSSLWTNNSNLACYLGFDSSGVDTCSNVRSEGLSVRPVSD